MAGVPCCGLTVHPKLSTKSTDCYSRKIEKFLMPDCRGEQNLSPLKTSALELCHSQISHINYRTESRDPVETSQNRVNILLWNRSKFLLICVGEEAEPGPASHYDCPHMGAAQPSAAAHTNIAGSAAAGLDSLHVWHQGRDESAWLVSRRYLGCAEEIIVSVWYQCYSSAPLHHQYHRPQLKLFQFFI